MPHIFCTVVTQRLVPKGIFGVVAEFEAERDCAKGILGAHERLNLMDDETGFDEAVTQVSQSASLAEANNLTDTEIGVLN